MLYIQIMKTKSLRSIKSTVTDTEAIRKIHMYKYYCFVHDSDFRTGKKREKVSSHAGAKY